MKSSLIEVSNNFLPRKNRSSRKLKSKPFLNNAHEIDHLPHQKKRVHIDAIEYVRDIQNISNSRKAKNKPELTNRLKWVNKKLDSFSIYTSELQNYEAYKLISQMLIVPFISDLSESVYVYLIPTERYLHVNGAPVRFERSTSAVMGLDMAHEFKRHEGNLNTILFFIDGYSPSNDVEQIKELIQTKALGVDISGMMEIGPFSESTVRYETEESTDSVILDALIKRSGLRHESPEFASEIYKEFQSDYYTASIIDSCHDYEKLEEFIEMDLDPFHEEDQLRFSSTREFKTICNIIVSHARMRYNIDYSCRLNFNFKH